MEHDKNKLSGSGLFTLLIANVVIQNINVFNVQNTFTHADANSLTGKLICTFCDQQKINLYKVFYKCSTFETFH